MQCLTTLSVVKLHCNTFHSDCEQQSRKIPEEVWVFDSLPGSRSTDYAKRTLTASIENHPAPSTRCLLMDVLLKLLSLQLDTSDQHQLLIAILFSDLKFHVRSFLHYFLLLLLFI
jgi:hypothetical protein